MHYKYRPIRSPEDLRPNERLVAFNYANPQRVVRGGQDLLPREITCFYGERTVPFQSRIARRRARP